VTCINRTMRKDETSEHFTMATQEYQLKKKF
jgi:hypothetical protein